MRLPRLASARAGAIAIVFCTGALPQPAGQRLEQPVGIVLAVKGGRLVRAGNELPLSAAAGDLLFPGDTLRAADGSATFAFCPTQTLHTISGQAVVTMETSRMKAKTGAVGPAEPWPLCVLPAVERNPSPSLLDAAAGARAAPPSGSLERRLELLPAEKQAALRAELAAAEGTLAKSPRNLAGRVTRAELLARYGLAPDAAEEYRKFARELPDAAWVRQRLLVLESQPMPKSPQGVPGKTYALLVGISRYQTPAIMPLNFAHRDADLFREYLRKPRGGQVAEDNIFLLQDSEATAANIRAAFERLKKLPLGVDDSIILLFASHGTAEGAGRRAKGYLVTYDSDPQELKTTGLPMEDVRRFIMDDLSRVGLVMAFVDVCRAGKVGEIPSGNVNAQTQFDPGNEIEGELFLFAGSRADESSVEGPQFGGGHGAFSYAVADALNGAADKNGDGTVSINEVIDYVRNLVTSATYDKQHPQENGSAPGRRVLVADIQREGLVLARAGAQPQQMAKASLRDVSRRSSSTPPAAEREEADFEEALAAGRLLQDEERNAFTALGRLQGKISPGEYLEKARRLRVALENRGQQVLLRYIQGDQTPQVKDDFMRGAAYFSAAQLLSDANLFLESRAAFCLGRAALFERDYQRGSRLLERAARLDPERAYAYNGLGISLLEQARYSDAVLAFHDAIRKAPYWAYPRHNLALAYTQAGDYANAIRAYEEAMRLAPRYSYLPYNLGLLYYRLNRRKEARGLFERASALSPGSAEPYNALGALAAAEGRAPEAELQYRAALERDFKLAAARHNLAVLLAGEPGRFSEAVGLWRENLAQSPDYIPSRFSLARALSKRGQRQEAIQEYRALIQAKPEYAAARLELAELLAASGADEAALAELQRAAELQPRNVNIYERIADLQRAAGHPAEARAAFAKALSNTVTRADRKRLRRKARL